MLSLVSYGSSGESEDEDNSDNGSTSPDIVKIPNSITKPEKKEDDKYENKGRDGKQEVKRADKINDNPHPLNASTTSIPSNSKEDLSSEDNLLSTLPPPVTDLRSIPWDQLSKLTYKSKAIRIMAPSIPAEDVEEKKEKKLPSKTGSGLLAMLPKPRNQFLATPRVLKPRTQTTPAPVKPKLLPKPMLMSTKKLEDHESDSDGETDDKIDFFSLTSAPEVSEINLNDSDLNLPVTSDIPMPSHSQMDEIPLPVNQPASSSDSQRTNASFRMDIGDSRQQSMSSYDYVPFQQPNDELQLDSEALEALCGTRGRKRKGGKDDGFKVIDINGSELTPDAQELLAKNLTADQPRPKRSKDGPTSQQKRKHQIIYLAHQAKEQELELQNTWSNNRMTKKQTQAKYGF